MHARAAAVELLARAAAVELVQCKITSVAVAVMTDAGWIVSQCCSD